MSRATETREELIAKGYTPSGADEVLQLRAWFARMRAKAEASRREEREAAESPS